MSIEDIEEKIKGDEIVEEYDLVPKGQNLNRIERPILLISIMVLIALFAFGLGRLSTKYSISVPVKITSESSLSNNQLTVKEEGSVSSTVMSSGPVYASKNGTRYYYPNCAGIKKINKENLVTYTNIKIAQQKGLTLATGCRP